MRRKGVRKGSKPSGPRPPVTPSRPQETGRKRLASFLNETFREELTGMGVWPVEPADAVDEAIVLLEQLAIWKA